MAVQTLRAETAPPSVITKRAWQTLAITSVSSFLVALDTTIVAVALPAIAHSFPGTRRATLGWIFTSYSVGLATLLLLSGKLSDRYGRKRMFISGLSVFFLGSVLAGLAPSIGLLIAARVVQAVGGSMLSPAATALLLPEFPPEKRSFAIGIWGMTASLSAAAAPTLGAFIISAGGWRWAFLVNIPGVAAALFYGRRILRESYGENRNAKFDPIGVPIGSLGVGFAVFAITQQEVWGWIDARTIGLLAASVFGIIVLLYRSAHHPSPLLDLKLFGIRTFTVAILGQCLFAMAYFGWSVLNPTFYTSVWHFSPLRAGFAIAPSAFMAALVSPFAGKWADRVGHRWLCGVGSLIAGLCLAWWATQVGVQPAYWTKVFPVLIVIGIATGATFSTFISGAMRNIPGRSFATAGSARYTLFQMAVALGISISVAVQGERRTPADLVVGYHRTWTLSASLLILAGIVMMALYRPLPHAAD